MNDDIVARLRLYAKRMDETRSTVLGLLLADAADEIARLRSGGCARDQATTQFCAEAVRLERERDKARILYCVMRRATDGGRTEEQYAKEQGWTLPEEYR